MAKQDNLPSKILVVDDDPSVAQAMEEPLGRYGIKVDKAVNLETALYLFNQNRYDAAVVELEFGELTGLAIVQKWRAHEMAEKRCVGIIMASGNKASGQNQALFRELGDLQMVNKPFTTVQILPFLSRAKATKARLVAYYETKNKIENYFSKTGDFDKAAEEVQKRLSDLGPRGLDMLYDLFEKGERYEDALAILQPMLEKDPQNISLNNAMGRMLLKVGRFKDAKKYMETSDKLAPGNIDRINKMTSLYLELNMPDESVKKMKEYIALTPENPNSKFEMFAKLYSYGYDEHAIEMGKELAKPMEIIRHYNNKGVMMSKDGQLKAAITEYNRALRFFPKFRENYRIHYNIALAYIQLKNREAYEHAQRALRTCLELQPEFEKAQKTLETIEAALNKGKKSAS